jgi:hypothetical protein
MRGTGIADVRDWGRLFAGNARFAVFTHQDWFDWVQAHGVPSELTGWLQWIEARYKFAT